MMKVGSPEAVAVLERGKEALELLEQTRGLPRRLQEEASRLLEVLRTEAEPETALRIDPKNPTKTQEELLKIVRHQRHLDSVHLRKDHRVGQELEALYAAARPAGEASSFWQAFKHALGANSRIDRALAMLPVLEELLDSDRLQRQLKRANTLLRGPSTRPVWEDFLREPAVYYSYLAKLGIQEADPQAATGRLPEEIADAVKQCPLNEKLLAVSLRGYQSFGARYALTQRRVLLGDEMGLGKTIQALAVLAHLAAEGETGFLVVCPAAVVSNWAHEVEHKSRLKPVVFGSTGRKRALTEIQQPLKIGIASYDTVRSMHQAGLLDELPVSLLVADEAHYVKNADSLRSKAVAALSERAKRVLFLSGTPLENRLQEFHAIIGYLQPGVIDPRLGALAVGNTALFRKEVAPVYLRRNQEDVLSELPEKIEADEWLTIGKHERHAYEQKVREKNFMGMRRAVVIGDGKTGTAKLERLKELVEEALEDGQKVLVFSFFREVIERVMQSLGTVFGPITGETSSAERMRMIQEFTQTETPAVLVAQIQAGGTGLNIQAASVVILMEPQIKPSMESQAIARAHRMGQVRPVQVYRLLASESVDQQMVEMLAEKSRLFDVYARESSLKEAAEEAVDVSDTRLAREIIRRELERLERKALDADGE